MMCFCGPCAASRASREQTARKMAGIQIQQPQMMMMAAQPQVIQPQVVMMQQPQMVMQQR